MLLKILWLQIFNYQNFFDSKSLVPKFFCKRANKTIFLSNILKIFPQHNLFCAENVIYMHINKLEMWPLSRPLGGGHKYKLYKKRCSAIVRFKFYSERVVSTWNNLPDSFDFSSITIVGQSSLISLAHRRCDWHPGSRCGWTCKQLTSKVDGGITGSRLR